MIWTFLTACALHPGSGGRATQAELERQIATLQGTVTQLRTTCAGPERPDQLFAELSGVLGRSEATVTRADATTVVEIPVATVFSDPWSTSFREEGDHILDLVATSLRLHPDYQVRIEGHTGDRSIPSSWVRSYPDHLMLSFAYASAVQLRMSDSFTVAAERFTVSARGDWAPIASNDIPSGQAQNDRIVLYISPGPGR